jgi:quinol-cytochrome oxidoreductase complex cytochrome b subunit
LSSALGTWIRWTVGVLVVSFVVLLATGLWLIWNYRPIAVNWSAITDGPGSVRDVAVARFLHRGAAPVMTMAAIALAVEGGLLARTTRRWRAVGPGALATVLAVIGGVSGSVLAWDQIALSAAVAGREGRGFRLLYSPLVREWRVDGRAFSADAMPRWFWAHTTVVALLLLVLLVATVIACRRNSASDETPGVG